MAHVHAFGDVAPAAKPVIHLGATSAYVTDNADLILMRRGPRPPPRAGWWRRCGRLPRSRAQWRDEPTLGYTHLQPAQLTTVGKRATLWMQDLVLDLTDLDYRRRHPAVPRREGNDRHAGELSRAVQGRPRARARARPSGDGGHGLHALACRHRPDVHAQDRRAGARRRRRHRCVSAAKFSGDIRMLQAFGEIEEPFEAEQIGSSAMAYKRNPMRSERIASLARFVGSLEPNANQTHAVQYFERTLDDSANRRLVIPESFLATDAILVLMGNIAGGPRGPSGAHSPARRPTSCRSWRPRS